MILSPRVAAVLVLIGTLALPRAALAEQVRADSETKLYSAFTICNWTSMEINYETRVPGQEWKSARLAAKKSMAHWINAPGKTLEIRFDHSFEDGYQEKRFRLPGRDYLAATSPPKQLTDGQLYSFRMRQDNKGLMLHADFPLDKTRMPEERKNMNSMLRGFPKLYSNFEVLDHSTTDYSTYNCIAWTIGIKEKWVWPGASVAAFDELYGSHGYQRSKGMDFRMVRGMHKLVLYGQTKADGTLACTHGAKQEPNGSWTSKLGKGPLIRHLYPEDLNGPSYGRPIAVYVKRVVP